VIKRSYAHRPAHLLTDLATNLHADWTGHRPASEPGSSSKANGPSADSVSPSRAVRCST